MENHEGSTTEFRNDCRRRVARKCGRLKEGRSSRGLKVTGSTRGNDSKRKLIEHGGNVRGLSKGDRTNTTVLKSENFFYGGT